MTSFFKRSTGLALLVIAGALPGRIGAAPSLALDREFRPPLFSHLYPSSRVLLLPDGKFVLYFGSDTLTDQRTGPITRHLPDGALDHSFNFSREYKAVRAAASLPNGQLLVSAVQRIYGRAEAVEQILRLNGDGSIDSSFNAATVGDVTQSTPVRFITILPDGKILVAGFFNTFAGTARTKIVRLLADGVLDTSFNPPVIEGGSGISAEPAVLPSGKILIGGDFTTVNGAANLGVAQLNSDGSLDQTFQASGFARAFASIRGIVVQPDGKIVLAGRFQPPGATTPRIPLLRLNADGSRDMAYVQVPISSFGRSYSVRALPDGKLLVGLDLYFYRFNADGSRDNSFAEPGFGSSVPSFSVPSVYTINLQPDGRILCGGFFTDIYGPGTRTARFSVVRFNSDGSIDPSLAIAHKTGNETFPSSFAQLSDGSTLLTFPAHAAGLWNIPVAPTFPFNFARLLPTGAFDPQFTLSTSDRNTFLTPTTDWDPGFNALDSTRFADDSFFIWGMRESDDLGAPKIFGAKFRANGKENRAYHVDREARAFERATAVADGKLLLAATSDANAVAAGETVTRLRADGLIDHTFRVAESIRQNQIVRASDGSITELFASSHVLAVQPDGKLLFGYLATDRLFHVVRLNVDGSVDSAFTPSAVDPVDLAQSFRDVYDPTTYWTGVPLNGIWRGSSPVLDAHVQADGGIVLAGRFRSFNGVPARGMVRLTSNGTVDASFATGGGAQWTVTPETSSFFPVVEAIEPQVGGKLLIAGTFEAFNGTPLPGLASLNADGSVDSSYTPLAKRLKFATGTGRLGRQADGAFLLSGPYSFPEENDTAFIRIDTIGGVPEIGSATAAIASVGQPFSHRIVASGQPTHFEASGLPAGFTVDAATGVITGTATDANVGVYVVSLTASNAEGTSAPRQLTLTVPAALRVVRAALPKGHGSSGIFDLELPLTGAPAVECRVSSGFHSMMITFSKSIVAGEATVTSGVGLVDARIIEADTMELDLTGIQDQQTITVTLEDVTDSSAQVLPDTAIKIRFLVGDTNGNGTVNASDIGQTKAQSGVPVTAGNFRNDVNRSGTLTASDIAQVKANAGNTAP